MERQRIALCGWNCRNNFMWEYCRRKCKRVGGVKWVAFIVLPLALTPILFTASDKLYELRCLYTLILMSVFWVFQILPLPVTSMIPLVLIPFFQIMSTKDVAMQYFTSTNFLFISGLILAIAVEETGLDKRLALRCLKFFGVSFVGLQSGIMTITAFLSMLVSNTATAAMMIPIAEGIIRAIDMEQNDLPMHQKTVELQSKRNCLLLSIAYAANIGGTGLITGTPPNLVVPQNLERLSPDASLPFLHWAIFAIPLLVVNVFVSGAWLYFLFQMRAVGVLIEEEKREIETALEQKRREIGRVTFSEYLVSVLFFLVVALWFCKDPKIFNGWGSYFPNAKIASATPAFMVVIVLFIVPAIPASPTDTSFVPILSWKLVESKMQWGLALLLGGGYALAAATKESGLGQWLVDSIKEPLKTFDTWVINLIFSVVSTFATEVVSNTATANILVPILMDISVAICQNPIYLSLTAALSCSYAFMIPIATAPNALVFSVSTLESKVMMFAGMIMNIFCIITTSVAINTYGQLVFGFSSMPKWLDELFVRQNMTSCMNVTDFLNSTTFDEKVTLTTPF